MVLQAGEINVGITYIQILFRATGLNIIIQGQCVHVGAVMKSEAVLLIHFYEGSSVNFLTRNCT